MRNRRSAAEDRAMEDLFHSRSENHIGLRHPLARLAVATIWPALEQALSANLPADPVCGGRPALPAGPVIGHLKQQHRLDCCWLKGRAGDACNAVLSAAGYNLRWRMRWIEFLRAWIPAIALISMAARSVPWLAVAC